MDIGQKVKVRYIRSFNQQLSLLSHIGINSWSLIFIDRHWSTLGIDPVCPVFRMTGDVAGHFRDMGQVRSKSCTLSQGKIVRILYSSHLFDHRQWPDECIYWGKNELQFLLISAHNQIQSNWVPRCAVFASYIASILKPATHSLQLADKSVKNSVEQVFRGCFYQSLQLLVL